MDKIWVENRKTEARENFEKRNKESRQKYCDLENSFRVSRRP